MVGPDSSLEGGLVAAAVLLLINFTLGRVVTRSRRVERIVRGRARLLVHRGQIDYENLREEDLTHDDLLQALRENGCATVEECRLAVLEVDGTISVIPREKADR